MRLQDWLEGPCRDFCSCIYLLEGRLYAMLQQSRLRTGAVSLASSSCLKPQCSVERTHGDVRNVVPCLTFRARRQRAATMCFDGFLKEGSISIDSRLRQDGAFKQSRIPRWNDWCPDWYRLRMQAAVPEVSLPRLLR